MPVLYGEAISLQPHNQLGLAVGLECQQVGESLTQGQPRHLLLVGPCEGAEAPLAAAVGYEHRSRHAPGGGNHISQARRWLTALDSFACVDTHTQSKAVKL